MKRLSLSVLSRFVFVLLAAVVLGGCLQFESTVTVRRDGSGVIEQRFMMKREFVEMIAGMQSMPGSQNEGSEDESEDEEGFSLLDEEEVRAAADDIGENVRFVSAEELSNEFGEGYVARYEFDDISTVTLNQNPGELVPSTGGGDAPTDGTVENIRFRFTEGNPSTLEILMPEPEEVEPEDDEDSSEMTESSEDMNPEMFRQFYADMRIRMHVRFDGEIVETNATAREGNSITLMDLDFNQLLAEEDALDRVLNSEPETIAEMQELVSEVEGITVETASPVRIRFR
jgi:hypothetical protein